jgi:predicted DNA-binding transcriptional regulator AlpA
MGFRKQPPALPYLLISIDPPGGPDDSRRVIPQHRSSPFGHLRKGGTMQDQKFINQNKLSERWGISPRTLERWRWLGTGPRYHKIGGRVVYRIEDVEEWENTRIFNCTAEMSKGEMK